MDILLPADRSRAPVAYAFVAKVKVSTTALTFTSLLLPSPTNQDSKILLEKHLPTVKPILCNCERFY